MFPNKLIKYWKPTDDGLLFMKKYENPDNINDIIYSDPK